MTVYCLFQKHEGLFNIYENQTEANQMCATLNLTTPKGFFDVVDEYYVEEWPVIANPM